MPSGISCPSGRNFKKKDCRQLKEKVPSWKYGKIGNYIDFLPKCFLWAGERIFYNIRGRWVHFNLKKNGKTHGLPLGHGAICKRTGTTTGFPIIDNGRKVPNSHWLTSISASIQLQPQPGVSCSGGGRIPLTKDECHESGTPLLIEKVKKRIADSTFSGIFLKGQEIKLVDKVKVQDMDRDIGPGYLKGCFVKGIPATGYRIYYNTGNGADPATRDRSQHQAICKDRVTG